MSIPFIAGISGHYILDSRGDPTVRAEVILADGTTGAAASPSGASRGSHESAELRDNVPADWNGRGVTRAIHLTNTDVCRAFRGRDPSDQAAIDALLIELDGTANRSRLGANTMLAVSVACARAASAVMSVPLWNHLSLGAPRIPRPMVNMLSGNLHAPGGMDLQDILVMPLSAASYEDALKTVWRVRRAIRARLINSGLAPLVGDEGGFGLQRSSELGLALVRDAIADEGIPLGVDVGIALDVAAEHLKEAGHYRLDGSEMTAGSLASQYSEWCDRYALTSIEDPFGEDDWTDWSQLVQSLGGRLQIVGDDLIATHSTRLDLAIARRAATAVLVKPDQIGTVSEALGLASQARDGELAVVVSARSGETEDDWLADFAVAAGADQIKIGSLARSERLSKYNRLLRIAAADDAPPFSSVVRPS